MGAQLYSPHYCLGKTNFSRYIKNLLKISYPCYHPTKETNYRVLCLRKALEKITSTFERRGNLCNSITHNNSFPVQFRSSPNTLTRVLRMSQLTTYMHIIQHNLKACITIPIHSVNIYRVISASIDGSNVLLVVKSKT